MRKKAKANLNPVRQRTQYTCMSTSMAMCLNALGLKCNEDEVNEVMGARPMKGAAWESALACAQHYGCRATLTTPSTLKQVKSWTDAGNPVMIAWNPEGRPWSHASVIFDVDDDFNVYVADPNIPDPDETIRIVPKKDFYKMWYEKWPNYLVRRPALKLEREVSPDGRQVLASNRWKRASFWEPDLKSDLPSRIPDVAKLLQIPADHIYEMVKQGLVKGHRVPGIRRSWVKGVVPREVKRALKNFMPPPEAEVSEEEGRRKRREQVDKANRQRGFGLGFRRKKAQGSPLRLQRDYGEDEMLNIEEMEKTLKKSSNMVTLKTWEHQYSRPEIREVPYKHAMAMASRGGFFKAQIIGDFDQVLFENKAGFRAAGLMAFDDSEMFEEDETQDEIEDLSDDFELMALDDFEMSVTKSATRKPYPTRRGQKVRVMKPFRGQKARYTILPGATGTVTRVEKVRGGIDSVMLDYMGPNYDSATMDKIPAYKFTVEFEDSDIKEQGMLESDQQYTLKRFGINPSGTTKMVATLQDFMDGTLKR